MKILVNGEELSLSRGFRRANNYCKDLLEINNYGDLLSLDRQIAHIKKNKHKYAQLVLLLAFIIPETTLTSYALASAGNIGMEAYAMGKQVAKAICLIGWLTEGIKCVITGTVDGLSKVSIKWISFALMIKFLPSAVDWIFNV